MCRSRSGCRKLTYVNSPRSHGDTEGSKKCAKKIGTGEPEGYVLKRNAVNAITRNTIVANPSTAVHSIFVFRGAGLLDHSAANSIHARAFANIPSPTVSMPTTNTALCNARLEGDRYVNPNSPKKIISGTQSR